MHLTPIHRFDLRTSLSQSEITDRLRGSTEIGVGFFPHEKTFQGQINTDSFVLSPNRWVNTGPIHLGRRGGIVIQGVIDQALHGATVRVTLRLPAMGLIFTAIWIFFFSFGSIIGILAGSPAPLFMGVIGYLFMIIPFNNEATKAEETLSEMLK